MTSSDHTYLHGNGNVNHHLETGFSVCKGNISAVKRVEFISNRMSYTIQRGRWCDDIVLNVRAPTEDRSDDAKDSFYEVPERVLDELPKYHMKMLLGYFNAKVGREDILKPTAGNENLREIINDNGTESSHICPIKKFVKSTMLPHRNIYKYIWTLPEGKTHQLDHVLTDKGRHSDVADDRFFRGAHWDTDHYLDVAEVKETLSIQTSNTKFGTERFNLKWWGPKIGIR
jgi:hypothetical protein